MAIDTKTGAAKFLGFPLRNTVWSWGGQHSDEHHSFHTTFL